ncbi:tRNA uridine-5-carboxymethylaminomethyl(34) synthesis GTPase MnmE, partial [Neisseria meningitidis]
DLAQAEGVADLFDPSSPSAARLALRPLKGDFSRGLHSPGHAFIILPVFVKAPFPFPAVYLYFFATATPLGHLDSFILALERVV